MANNNFIDNLKQELYSQGLTLGTRKATTWLLQKVGLTKALDRAKLMSNEERKRSRYFMGGMFFFWYDPKTKDKLPYYDRFPLVIPIEAYSDGFLGLNLHYLEPKARIALLDRLTQFTNNTRYDERTRFTLTYNTLAGASRLPQFRPCIKRYLAGHIRSNFLAIPADEWHIASLLPVHKFTKESAQAVWEESMRIVRGYR